MFCMLVFGIILFYFVIGRNQVKIDSKGQIVGIRFICTEYQPISTHMDPGNLKNHDFRRFKQLPFLKIKARSSFWRARRGLFFSKSQDLVLACPQGSFFSLKKPGFGSPRGSSFKIDGGLPLWVQNLLLWSRNLPLWTRNLPLKVVAATAAPTLPSRAGGQDDVS